MKPRTLHCDLPDTRLQQIAEQVRYVGSSEHKSYKSPAGPPRLRSDATPCDKGVKFSDINAVLTESVRRGCISSVLEQGFPKYVWGWIGDDLYEARHLNGNPGSYKGYKLEPPEYPRDNENRLSRE